MLCFSQKKRRAQQSPKSPFDLYLDFIIQFLRKLNDGTALGVEHAYIQIDPKNWWK